jgi:hypothetical protein
MLGFKVGLFPTKISEHLGVIGSLKKMKTQFFNRVVDNGIEKNLCFELHVIVRYALCIPKLLVPFCV